MTLRISLLRLCGSWYGQRIMKRRIGILVMVVAVIIILALAIWLLTPADTSEVFEFVNLAG